MNICALVWLVVGAILNAVTFDLLVNIPITYIANLPAPWATGVLAALLTPAACAVYRFPILIFPITEDKLVTGLVTFFKYLLPWIVIFRGCSNCTTSNTITINGSTVVVQGCFCSSVVVQADDQGYRITTRDCVDFWKPLVYFCRLVVICRFFHFCYYAGVGIPT